MDDGGQDSVQLEVLDTTGGDGESLMEMESSVELAEESSQVEFNPEAAANVSSAIMFKIATKSLNALRGEFEKVPEGLNLIQFLGAFVKNMELEEDEEELLRVVPDLLDFFKSVDINGDGKMEWSEFVAFVIESVVSSDPPVTEKFVNVSRHTVQAAGLRATVRCSRMMPEFRCLFVGVGAQIVIYETDDQSPTWLSPKGVRIPLISRDGGGTSGSSSGSHGASTNNITAVGDDKKKESESGPRAKVDTRLQDALCSLDFCYLLSRDILIVLRSDLCLEFHKFMSRSKIHPDFILASGVWPLSQPYNKLAIRETHNTPWRLFAVGENRKVVDSWLISVGISGAVELSDYQGLERHTDFLRDVLVIHTDLYDLLVTCGMDKKVYLWDLTTLQYKATRSGHSGGVQCVAFDGRSLVLAGGFDFKIIAWDLDAEIDRPLFQLWGHQSVITKIVAVGSINRAFSLDASGRMRLWDTSKASPNDKEERQIDDTSFTQDTFRQFDVLRNVSTKFPSAHRVIVTMQGRRNHVYKLVDTAPTESAPLRVLFSSSLLMMLTLHSFDVLFFSAVSGWEQNKLDRAALGLEDKPGNEVQTGVLDDRERKLILGDSAGGIIVYNCLSGVKLKTLSTQIPFSCRFMIYTPEKIVIAIAGPGELYILDELPNFPTGDMTMRDTRAHEVDVVAVAYSFELGLIATADCTGTVCVWSFEFITLEAVIHDCTGTEIGQIAFVGKFPLLLVTDARNNFTLVGVGPAFARLGKTLWRVEAEIFLMGSSSRATALGVLNLDEAELSDLAERDERAQEGAGERRATSTDEEAEEEEDAGSSNKPLTKRQLHDYLRTRRDCRSISILVQKSARLLSEESIASTPADDAVDPDQYRLNQLLGATAKKGDKEEADDDDDEEFLAAISGTKAFDPDEESKEKQPQGASVAKKKKVAPKAALPGCVSLGFPSLGVRVFAVCGHDDGSVTISDLTPALRAINLGELQPHEMASSQSGYDPRRTSRRKATDYERNRSAIWTAADVEPLMRYVPCRLSLAWVAHAGAVTTLQLICDNDVLTGSADGSVMLWTLDGKQKGVLTRGREWDKLFRPRWTTPVDMHKRQRQRRRDARLLVEHLGLSGLMKKKPKRRKGEVEREMVFGESEGSERGSEQGSERGHGHRHGHDEGHADMDARAMLKQRFGADEAGASALGPSAAASPHSFIPTAQNHPHSHPHTQAHPYTHPQASDETSVGVSVLSQDHHFEGDPERVRVIGQLHGQVTYHQSTKDAAKDLLAAKYAAGAATKADARGRGPRRARKGGGYSDERVEPEPKLGANGRLKVVKSVAARYLDDLMSVGSDAASADGLTPQALSAAAAGEKKRHIRSKYDVELELLDANDPNNWEIHSANRQRALYRRLYIEMDKSGYTKDPMAVFEAKLNALSPGGEFREYVSRLHEERAASLAASKSQQARAVGAPSLSSSLSDDLLVGTSGRVDIVTVQVGAPESSSATMTLVGGVCTTAELGGASMTASAFGLGSADGSNSPAPSLAHAHAPLSLPSPSLSRSGHSLPSLRPEGSDYLPAAGLLVAPLLSPLSPQKAASRPPSSPAPKLDPTKFFPEASGEKGLPAGSSLAYSSSFLTLTTSPEKAHRATPAQLAALAERQAILLKSAEFELRLKAADRLSRQASRAVHKQKGQYRKLARSMSEMALAEETMLPRIAHAEGTPSPGSPSPHPASTEPAGPESPMMGVLKEVLAVQASPAPLPSHVPQLPNTRHTHAGLLLGRQSSIDGVMEVTRKQKAAELNWVRKAKSVLALAEGEKQAFGTSRSKKRGKGGADKRAAGGGFGGGAAVADSAEASREARTQQQRQDQKLLERGSFGPYPTKELLGLLRAFQSMPQVFVPKTAEEVVFVPKQEEAPGEDDEWDFDDGPIDGPVPGIRDDLGSLDASTSASEEGLSEPVDPAAEAALLEAREQQRQQEEHAAQARAEASERARVEAEQALAEEQHREQVVAISIKLQPLIQHPFVRHRPACRSAMEKYLAQRAQVERELPHNIVLALADLLACAFPLMKPDDRRACLRFFVLHTPSEDVAEAAERGVTVPQLKKLREMFKFFDKDGSGGIDKVEILEVLTKLAENQGEGGGGEVGEDLIASVMGNSGQDLSFDDFAKIFKSFVQND